MLSTLEQLTQHVPSNPNPPCLSLYQPTHRHRPANEQDPIRFRNLVREMETSLRTTIPADQVRLLLEPFEKLSQDTGFWNHTLDGLAVLSAQGVFRVFRLQRPVREMAIVADSFHTKPLRRLIQSIDRYQVLALTRHEVELFEGNRDAIDRVDLASEVPSTITEALGEELSEPHQTVASYNGAGGAAMHHGHGGRKDDTAIDDERFFRAVDRAVLAHHSRPSGLPLILAGLAEQQAVFRRVTHNPFLMATGIVAHPPAIAAEDWRARAWQTMEPEYVSRLTRLGEAFGQSQAKGFGSDDLHEVASAAATGRVATLLIDADKSIGGRLDSATGGIELTDLADPEIDDVLDDLGTLVERMGGRVFVVPHDTMPTDTGVAASFRY
ncbi:MAG TPA: hypothetical protein VF701_12340 [Thermoanaerobaculia bacterium]